MTEPAWSPDPKQRIRRPYQRFPGLRALKPMRPSAESCSTVPTPHVSAVSSRFQRAREGTSPTSREAAQGQPPRAGSRAPRALVYQTPAARGRGQELRGGETGGMRWDASSLVGSMRAKADYSEERPGRANTLTRQLKIRAVNSSQENPADYTASKGDTSKRRLN